MEYFLFILAVTPLLLFRNRYSYWFVVAVVTVLMAIRGNEDEYSRYLRTSRPVSQILSDPGFLTAEKGPLLSLVNGVIVQFHLHKQFIFLFYIPLQILIFAYVCFRLTSSYHLAFLFAMCQSVLFTSMSGLRMGLTGSLTLLIILMIHERRYGRALATYAFSIANHYTALITPLMGALSVRQNLQTIALVGAAAIVVAISPVLEYVFRLFSPDPNVSLVTAYRLSRYSYQMSGFDFLKAAQQVAVCVLIVIHRKRILSDDIGDRLLFGAYILSTALLISFSRYAIFAYRLAAVFSLSEPILIGKIHSAYRRQLPVLGLVILAVSLTFAYLNYVAGNRVTPYELIVD